jgi:hypothetical protein
LKLPHVHCDTSCTMITVVVLVSPVGLSLILLQWNHELSYIVIWISSVRGRNWNDLWLLFGDRVCVPKYRSVISVKYFLDLSNPQFFLFSSSVCNG